MTEVVPDIHQFRLPLTGSRLRHINAYLLRGDEGYTLVGAFGIAGSAPLIKEGTGTLTIKNTNTYTGPTTISGGMVLAAISLVSVSSISHSSPKALVARSKQFWPSCM